MEKLEASYIEGGKEKWCSHCGKQFGSSVKHGITPRISNSTPGHMPQRMENSNSIYNSQKVETIHMFIN